MMKTLMFLSALLWVSPAFAAEEEHEAKGAGDEKLADKAEKEKEGGKFTLFGHECKAEEDEGPETTPGSPPLDVDDTGTPGCNAWEVNIVTSGEFGKSMSLETPLFDINYGVGDNLQIKVEAPFLLNRVDGVSKTGVGAGEIGLKYRFYDNEQRDMTVAVYPQVEFAIPGTSAANANEGTLVKFPVLMSTRVAETSRGNIMVTGNLGYNVSTSSDASDYVSAAFGIGFPLTHSLALMVEASTEQAVTKNADSAREAVYKANVGFLGKLSDNFLLFGSVGQNYASAEMDDSSHTCVVFGLRVLAGGP